MKYNLGVFAYKCGMTRFFTENGISIPVTVVRLYTNYLLEIKNINELYCLVKIAACQINKKKLSKSLIGLYKKFSTENLKYIKDFYVKKNFIEKQKIGSTLSIDLFQKGDKLSITGISKGKGFAGVIKKHNFSAQRATHGNSLSHRVPGSIGQCQDPGKVFKGKKMAGQLGNVNVTMKNITIVNINSDLNVILLKGGLPGAPGKKLIIKKIN